MALDLSGIRVLVVEDQYLLADELSRMMHDWGAAIIGPAASEDAAVRCFADDRVDLALLDISLGIGSAYPLAEHLRSRSVPFIFITAHSHEDVRQDFRDAPFIEKPFVRPQVEAAIRSMDVRGLNLAPPVGPRQTDHARYRS